MNTADFKISGNIEPQIGKPLDERITALSKFDDLTNKETWKDRYLYIGMIVPIINANTNDLYMLVNKNKPTLPESWIKINGGGFGQIDGGTAKSVYITRNSFPEGKEGDAAYNAAMLRGEIQVIDGGTAKSFK